jgi:hypothetical protein
MANSDGELTVAQRLGRALDSGLLPAGGPAEAAERLIERLERPARVALLGLPGSGKSSILNLLVGAPVVPETLRLPTLIVQHRTEARMICTLADGTSRTVPGLDLAEVLSLAPALVTLEMDLPALKVISLLEVSAGPLEAEQRRAATWAAKRADIVVWCTTSYLPKEQAVWESLPDAVKDNSFMFLTKVDLLGSRDSASAMHNRVELRAGEEFRQILSISARQARAAMPAGGPVNRDLFRDSGASAVISAIKTRVQSGRRADMDTAELLLARHAEATEFVARRFAEPGEDVPAAPAWNPPPEAEVAEPPAAETGPAVAVPELEKATGQEADSRPVEAEGRTDAPPQKGDAGSRDIRAEDAGATGTAGDAQAVDPDPAASDDTGTGTRRRFADRIKRVASSTDAATAPLVPLRSTWKSKADLEAPPEPEPEPVQTQVPVRRPRPTTQTPQDDGEVARMLANVAAMPDAAQAAAEAKAASTGDAADLQPDLSALRAWPEPEEPGEEDGLVEPEPESEEGAAGVGADGPEADVDPTTEDAGGSEFDAGTDRRLAALSAETAERRSVERPRLFDRQTRTKPAEPPERPRADVRTPAAPLSRLPAPPRMPAPVAAPADTAAAVRPPAGESQFSPRAIMARERPSSADATAPRRERTRIAARAVADAPPAAPVDTPAVETTLLQAAIDLIVTRSASLSEEIDPEAKVPVDTILDHAKDTTEQVMEIVARGHSEELRRINHDLSEVLDLILLMQLEKGHAPADDALTLILQLRREMETLRAA